MHDDIEMTREGTDCRIVIHHIASEQDFQRIEAILDAYRSMPNDRSDCFCYFYDDDLYEPNSSIGTRNIIPEGPYEGYTLQDIYSLNGHYSLSRLLQTIRKMKSMSPEKQADLYEETIRYTIPLIRRKEIDLDDFIHAYKPFLKGKGPTPEGDVEDWLNVPSDQQEIAYTELVENMIRRMEKSLTAAGGKKEG